MTASQVLEVEKGNTGKILVFREGTFFKAFERSAFQLCKLVGLKVLVHSPKSLHGDSFVTVGFPVNSAEKYLAGLALIEEEEWRRIYLAPLDLDEADFEKWKAEKVASAGVAAEKSAAKSVVTPTQSGSDNGGDHVAELIALLESFDIATNTPLNCMDLVIRMKSLLHKS